MKSLGANNLGIISNNQIKSELIQSTKDYTYKDYADYYSETFEDSDSEDKDNEEFKSFKKILKTFKKNKFVKTNLEKINKFLQWIDR